MADIIETNTVKMRQDADSIETKIREMRGDMKKMFEAVEALNATWSGADHDLFQQQFKKDGETFEDLCKFLDRMVSGMRGAADRYEKCEQSVEQRIDTIRV